MSMSVGGGVLFSACASIAGDKTFRSDDGRLVAEVLRLYNASRAERLKALSPRFCIMESVNRVLPAPLAPIITNDMDGLTDIVCAGRPSLRGGSLSSMVENLSILAQDNHKFSYGHI